MRFIGVVLVAALLSGTACGSTDDETSDAACTFADDVLSSVNSLAVVTCEELDNAAESITYADEQLGVGFEVFRSPEIGETVRAAEGAVSLTTPEGRTVIFEGGEAAKVRFPHESDAFAILILDDGPTDGSAPATAVALQIADALMRPATGQGSGRGRRRR